MSRKHFGTDGVRGVANTKLTPEFALALGQAAGRWLVQTGHTPRVVLGRDTRLSGPMLENACPPDFARLASALYPLALSQRLPFLLWHEPEILR